MKSVSFHVVPQAYSAAPGFHESILEGAVPEYDESMPEEARMT
jgi:hypothetical protein